MCIYALYTSPGWRFIKRDGWNTVASLVCIRDTKYFWGVLALLMNGFIKCPQLPLIFWGSFSITGCCHRALKVFEVELNLNLFCLFLHWNIYICFLYVMWLVSGWSTKLFLFLIFLYLSIFSAHICLLIYPRFILFPCFIFSAHPVCPAPERVGCIVVKHY